MTLSVEISQQIKYRHLLKIQNVNIRIEITILKFRRVMKSVVVVLGFYVPLTAKVIRRRDLGLKSHPKDWRSPGSISGPLV